MNVAGLACVDVNFARSATLSIFGTLWSSFNAQAFDVVKSERATGLPSQIHATQAQANAGVTRIIELIVADSPNRKANQSGRCAKSIEARGLGAGFGLRENSTLLQCLSIKRENRG